MHVCFLVNFLFPREFGRFVCEYFPRRTGSFYPPFDPPSYIMDSMHQRMMFPSSSPSVVSTRTTPSSLPTRSLPLLLRRSLLLLISVTIFPVEARFLRYQAPVHSDYRRSGRYRQRARGLLAGDASSLEPSVGHLAQAGKNLGGALYEGARSSTYGGGSGVSKNSSAAGALLLRLIFSRF